MYTYYYGNAYFILLRIVPMVKKYGGMSEH